MDAAASDASRLVSATPKAQPSAAGRLLFVDNIRVYLTILVLLHHLMITYAGVGGWYYKEGRQDFATTALGAWFCATNQAYFMGLFLLISAYFVPGSYDRKGSARFFNDRLVRLGIPLALFSWVINPLFVYFLAFDDLRMPLWSYFPARYFAGGELLGQGPLWFVETLLVFSLAYVLVRLLVPSRPAEPAAENSFPGNGSVALFALLLGVAGFLVRTVFVMNVYNFKPLNLQFPFFAQYITLFVVGLMAYRRNWLLALPERTGRLWLRIAILLVLLCVPMLLALGADRSDVSFQGGWTWQSLVYSLWEAFLCVGACIAVVHLFRRYLNHRGRIAGFLVPNAYTAYIIHAPVIVFLALAFRDVELWPFFKWAVLAPVAVALCFGLSGLVRKLPYADRVL